MDNREYKEDVHWVGGGGMEMTVVTSNVVAIVMGA